jgi:hypothetical protein
LYFRTAQDLSSDASIGLGFTFDLEIQGMKKVVAYDENQKEIAAMNINVLDILKKQNKPFKFDYPVDKPKRVRFNLKAFDAFGRQQFTTYRSVRIVPNPKDFLTLTPNSTVPVDFSAAKYAAQFDGKIAPGDGWNLKEKYIVGDGKQYQNNVDSKLSYFINSATPFKVAVNADYDTELDYDFLKVGYIKDGKVTQLLITKNKDTNADQEGISGKGTLYQTFDVPVTGPAEVFVQFLSDAGVTGVGATLNSVTFSA